MPKKAEIAVEILTLLKKRGAGKTICPSEAVRSLDEENWRDHMASCREVAVTLAQEGEIEICQKGESIDPDNFRGPVRLRRKL